MKKTLLSLFACGLIVSAHSQNNQLQGVDKTFKFDKYESNLSATSKGTISCDNDTVDYVLAKATGLSGLNLNTATSARSLGQYFNAPQAITIYGADFYAYKIDATGGASTNVTVEVYLAGADSLPTGAALASVAVPVDTTFGTGSLTTLMKTAVFTTPIVVSQPYIIVIDNNSANGIALVNNSYTAADGAQEWLSSANLFGTWTRSYMLSLGGNVFDADALIQPFVSYDVTVDFTFAGCLPSTGGGSISFTNASSPIINDRMYSLAAYLGNTDTSYIYNFGDDTTLFYEENPTHAYAVSGAYTVTLAAGIQGWRSTGICFEVQTGDVDICTGINENVNSSLTAYPNPTSSTFNIALNDTKATTIRITDITGKVVKTETVLSNVVNINVENLPVGLYVYQVINNESVVYTNKFNVIR